MKFKLTEAAMHAALEAKDKPVLRFDQFSVDNKRINLYLNGVMVAWLHHEAQFDKGETVNVVGITCEMDIDVSSE